MLLDRINHVSIILFLYLFLFQCNSFAQLTGTKTIPGDYATVEAAIADLNVQGVGSGGVTFNVAAGHIETFTSDTSGRFRATGTNSDPIVFQKSGVGANPVITAGVGTGTLDGIIVIAGGDYITFDGIDLTENIANNDDITRMEWGYALLKKNASAPVVGCQFVTIKNSTITLNKQNTATWGIYAANHTPTSISSLSLSDTLDVMSYCKLFSNTITNSYSGIRIISSTSSLFYGQGNEVGVDGGNSILDFGGGSSSAYGTNLEYQNNLKVANNTVNNGVGSGQTSVLYGIRTGSGTNSNLDIYGNTVTLTQGSSSLIYGITNSTGSSGVDNTVNIYNNTVENCLQPVSTSNTVWLIYNLASAYNINIYGNTVKNNTKTAGTGTMYCIYNSPTTAPMNVRIYANEIYNNSSAGTIHGIFADDGTSISIYENDIYNLRSTSTSTTLLATAGITIASGPINSYIYNNFISDLRAFSSAYGIGVRGINITSTTANSNIGLYYNTIYLNASGSTNFGSTGIYHTYSSTATSGTLDMRDNIIVNLSTPNGTGKTVAFRRSSATNLNNYSDLSNNNAFYAGTPGINNVIYYDGTNFDQTLEEFKLRVAPRETNSITENVPFVNIATTPYDLHVQTSVVSQTESGGTPIVTPITITNDYDGDARNASTPDIGADEFNGMGIDITPPSIIYTTLDHTTSNTNRTLADVTITDQSGVNVTPGTAPRIYFKRASDNNTYVDNTSSTNGWKYTETSNINSPFSFLLDYSLLYGGTGVQSGDTVQYFVVAQDLATTANVGINQGTFNLTPTSVNLTSAAFPLTGTINFYRIIILLNGTVTVGTGGNYLSLTGANGLFAAFNENIVIGNVTAQIISDITESGTNALNQWVESGAGNYTITIQPGSAVLRTLLGAYPGGLIRLEGADRVTIDGRFNSSGHYLTLENTSASSNTATIQLLSLGAGQGCTDVTIRNCNIKAGSNTLSNIFGIFCGSSTGSLSTGNAGGADYDNISILENNISKCREGIFARGTSSDQMQNFIVSGNVIGSDNPNEYVNEYGMYLGYADAPQVTYNEVYNMFYDVSKWGIYFTSNINNAIVSKNKIHSIKQPGTTGYNSVGIVFWSSTGCFDNQIDNNMIYDLSTYGNTSMYLVGIRISGGSNYKVWYNSVCISDTIGNPASGVVSSCLYISTASTNMDVRNNIFSNTRFGGTSPKNYAVFSPNTTTFTSINYNDYWTTGSVLGYFGSDISTLGDWRTATGQDLNSISKEVFFVSNTDLHLTGTSNGDFDLAGIPIAGISSDIDDDIRNTTFPYMGADEAFIPLPVELTSFSAEISNRDIIINWSTVTEKNNEGFEIERKLGGDWEKIGFKEGNGTTTEQSFYSFTDNFAYESYQGKVFYRLKQMDFDGTYTYSSEIEIDADFTPKEYTLYQNYPNPFNPITTIKYSLPFESNVRIAVYNVLGELVDVLVDELKQVGFYDFNWNASNLSSGIYIYRIEAKSVSGDQRFSSVKKMILMK